MWVDGRYVGEARDLDGSPSQQKDERKRDDEEEKQSHVQPKGFAAPSWP